jgi:hypothetical protein
MLVEGGPHGDVWLYTSGGQCNDGPCHCVNHDILTFFFVVPKFVQYLAPFSPL